MRDPGQPASTLFVPRFVLWGLHAKFENNAMVDDVGSAVVHLSFSAGADDPHPIGDDRSVANRGADAE